jgi:IS5 family transposase
MSQRLIGQERLKVDPTSRGGAPLERLSSLIDWQPLAALLAPLYPSAKGEPAWPPLAMFKALLLEVWYDLSDVKLAEALEDRASFRRFCGFAASEPTPERTAFVRFRRTLIAHGLDQLLFEEVTRQLKKRAITIKTGTLVDATIIASASKDDDEARWLKHRGRGAVHGFKAHVGADADTALVEAVSVTPANVNDGREGPAILPDDPGDVFADSAYRGQHFTQAVRAKGGVPRVAATAMWGRDEAQTLARLAAWNGAIQRVRARVEKIFGTWKRCYGLRRMRWRGLARATAQVHFTATAYNLKRSLNLLPA